MLLVDWFSQNLSCGIQGDPEIGIIFVHLNFIKKCANFGATLYADYGLQKHWYLWIMAIDNWLIWKVKAKLQFFFIFTLSLLIIMLILPSLFRFECYIYCFVNSGDDHCALNTDKNMLMFGIIINLFTWFITIYSVSLTPCPAPGPNVYIVHFVAVIINWPCAINWYRCDKWLWLKMTWNHGLWHWSCLVDYQYTQAMWHQLFTSVDHVEHFSGKFYVWFLHKSGNTLFGIMKTLNWV